MYLVRTAPFTHTGQYEQLGGVAEFLAKYLEQCLTLGYPAAPLEQDTIDQAACFR